MPRKEITFAVGSPNDLRSTVWKLRAQKRDLYLMGRDYGGIMKISFHADLSEDRLARTRENVPPAERHERVFIKWPRPAAVNGWTRLFDIVVPWTPVRDRAPVFRLNPRTEWVSPPERGQKRCFALFAADVTHGRLEAPNADQVGPVLELSDGRMAVLITALAPIEDDLAERAADMLANLMITVNGGSRDTPFLGTAHSFSTDGGLPWLLDVVLGDQNRRYATGDI